MRIGGVLERGAGAARSLLDYDGTLRELVGHPDLAMPTRRDPRAARRPRGAARTRTSTSSAAARARRSRRGSATCPIHLVRRARLPRPGRRAATGRRRTTSTSRGCRGSSGCSRRVAADVPGTLVERKAAQRRLALPPGRARVRRLARARAARRRSRQVLGGRAAEVLPGRRVIEVRARGVNKGAYLERVLAGDGGRAGTSCSPPATTSPTATSSARSRAARSRSTSASARPRRQTTLDHEYVVDSPRALRQTLRRVATDLQDLRHALQPEKEGAHRRRTPSPTARTS